MADLRIVDAPLLSTVKGTEKIPTGGEGNFSISVDQVADFSKLKWILATEGYVDNAVGNVQADLNLHKNNVNNPHQVTKTQVGLGNVDNTADLDKPVSNSTQAAIISAVAPKADKSYVDSQDQLKADKTELIASKIISDGGQNQQAINDFGGAEWWNKPSGYKLGATVKLTNGDIVKSTVANNTIDPNTDMINWVKTNSASQIFDASGENQQEINISILGTLSKKFTQYSTLSEAKSSTSLSINTTIYVNGFSATGDGGVALWDVIPAETVDNYTIVAVNDDPTKVLRLKKDQTVNPLMVGASTTVGFDNAPHLNALLKYKNVVIPEGTFEVGATVFASENSTVEFYGWIKTKAGVRLDTLFAASNPNITLINPLLDGNRDNTPSVAGNGIVHVLANYGTGINLKVRGGQIINGGHNIFQGGRNGLDVKGTKMSRCGEHMIYLNAIDNREPTGKHSGILRFTDIELDSPALETGHSAGNYIQLRNAGTVIIDGVKAKGAGTVSNTYPTIAVLATNVDDLVVKNGDFKDITSTAVWFGPDDTLGGGKNITVDNCKFKAITGGQNRLYDIQTVAGGKASFINKCEFDACFIISTERTTTPVFINDFTFKNIASEMLYGGTTKLSNGSLGFTDLAGRAMRVNNGELKIDNVTQTGTSSISVLVDDNASLEANDWSLPNKTSGQAVQTNNPKFISIRNSKAPLNTGDFIRVAATNTNPVFVIGNYAPQATLSILGTAPILAANKFLN